MKKSQKIKEKRLKQNINKNAKKEKNEKMFKK